MFEVGRDIIKNSGAQRGGGAGSVSRARLRIVYYAFIIVFVVFIGRTLQLGIHGTDRARRGAGDSEWAAGRADIVDRHGDILAKNIMSGNIVLRPREVPPRDRDRAAQTIHDVIPDIGVQQALEDLDSRESYIRLVKFADEAQRAAIKNAGIRGLFVEETFETETRRYPKGRLTAHAVGFVGLDKHGLDGIELVRDAYLTQNKDPLVLSIDSRVQSAMYQELSIAVNKYSAKGAVGLLMNSKTGEMIAMVSLPDYDPENISFDPPENRKAKYLRDVYEMGSIFKIFNTSMAIENGIPLSKEYYIAKPFHIFDRVITDVDSFRPPRPWLSVPEIMLYSCNVGSAQIALDLPDGAQKEFFERLRFDQKLDLDFGTTERPMMPAKWGPVERSTVAFGHGIAVTPMHLLLAVNAITNGGVYIQPTIFRRDPGAVRGTRVVSPEISDIIRKIMYKITTDTTARKAQVAGIHIGGKTGTAEKWVNGRKDPGKNLTVFVGSFPIESPQYTILVILDEPKGISESFGLRTAAWNAVPAAGAVLEAVLPLLFQDEQ